MPMVWMRKNEHHKTRFHRSSTCRQLRKRPSRGEPHDLIEVDLDEVDVRPCLTCYPDAPRYDLLKRYCQICDSRHPCEHNGGVAISRRGHGYSFYVWPDANSMPYYRRQARQQSA